MSDETHEDSANTKKAGAPKKSDKKVQIAIYLRKSVAFRWPRAKIEATIEGIENGQEVLSEVKPSLIQTKPQPTAPPLDKLAIARAALMGAEAKTGLSAPTELSEPLTRPFDTPVLDAKMVELWYRVDKLQDQRKALVHRFITLMSEEQCNVQGISQQLAQWQAQCEA